MNYKFRVYNKETQKIIYLDPLQWPLKVLDEEENWKVMMWTGLLDRRGKEIYEGDIVSRFVGGYAAFEVKWNVARNKNGWNIARGDTLEVIGDIYENPELRNVSECSENGKDE